MKKKFVLNNLFSIMPIISVLNLKKEIILTSSEKNLLMSLKILVTSFIYILFVFTLKCNVISVFCDEDRNSSILRVFLDSFKVQNLNLAEYFIIFFFLMYLFNNWFIINTVKEVGLEFLKYIKRFLTEFFDIFYVLLNFIKTYHTIFSTLAFFFFFHYGMERSILLLLLFEAKQLLLRFKFFQNLFDKLDIDRVTVQNHWKQDFDLIWCNRFLIFIRIFGFFIICLTLFNILVKPLIPYLVTTFSFDHPIVSLINTLLLNSKLGFLILVISFVFEFALNIHVILYRNNPVEKPLAMLFAASWKFITQTLPTVGSEMIVETQKLGSRLVEGVQSNSQNIKYTATALGAYEISKHPATKELIVDELDSPSNSSTKNFVQETVYGVKILKPYEKTQLNILTEIFPNVKGKEFGDLFAVDGRISESKIRDLYEKDPIFAAKFELHHLQHFGLGDKISPDIARESNKNNIARRGLVMTKERGLYIDETSFPMAIEKQIVPGRPNSDFVIKPSDTQVVKPNTMSFSSWAWGNKEQPPSNKE